MRYAFLLLLLVGTAFAQEPPVRFQAIDIYIESESSIAAWQFEFSERGGNMKVVGVENGDSNAFPDAPYFDRAAVNQGTADRIIVADYSLAAEADLPSGRTRLATIHIQTTGGAEANFDLRLITAVNSDGTRVDAVASIDSGSGS